MPPPSAEMTALRGAAPDRQPEISQLLASLAAGETTSEALVAERLERLATAWPTLNAFIAVRAEAALADARASDRRRRTGADAGPLEGIPVAVKDMFDVRGRSATCGAALRRGEAPGRTATAVERLTAAGAINLGFLNMAPFALGATGHNPARGDGHNPWNLQRIPGGSSSGAGAAVAAGVAAGALGSDTGGSIRIPAACCGAVGLRPTSGRISRHGAMPLAPSFDVIGPIAPAVADVALLFSVLNGPDPLDPTTHAVAGSSDGATRLLFPRDEVQALADPEVFRAVSAAVDVLTADGLACHAAGLPAIGELHSLADTVQAFEAATLHRDRLASQPEAYPLHIRRRIEPGLGLSASNHAAALSQRAARREAFVRETLGEGGVLIVPTLGQPIPTLAETDPESGGGDAVSNLTRWTRWVSYLDLPAVSLPCGFDSRGMPIGLQLIGAPDQDEQLLALALRYEQLTQWPNQAGGEGR